MRMKTVFVCLAATAEKVGGAEKVTELRKRLMRIEPGKRGRFLRSIAYDAAASDTAIAYMLAGCIAMELACAASEETAKESTVQSDCPGAGKCHGCACWCDDCGDVDLVCDGVGRCERHTCNELGCREPAALVTEGYGWCAEHKESPDGK